MGKRILILFFVQVLIASPGNSVHVNGNDKLPEGKAWWKSPNLIKVNALDHMKQFESAEQNVKLLREDIIQKDALIAAQANEIKRLESLLTEIKLGNRGNVKVSQASSSNSTILTSANWDTELHEAVRNQDEDNIKRLVKNGAYIDPRNKQLATPLILAGLGEDKEASLRIIKYLIGQRANVFAQDDDDRTFLLNLVADGTTLTPSQFHEIAEYLLSINLSELFSMPEHSSGNFPLHLAVKNIDVQPRTLSLFKMNGVNLNQVNKRNRNSIISFALEGKRNLNFLSDLTTLGVNWRHLNKYRNNALHLAAQLGHLEGVKYYCKLGLNVSAINSYGSTPLHYVTAFAKDNVLEIVKILIENGANSKIKNSSRKTPLDYVLARDDVEMPDKEKVVKLLRGM